MLQEVNVLRFAILRFASLRLKEFLLFYDCKIYYYKINCIGLLDLIPKIVRFAILRCIAVRF